MIADIQASAGWGQVSVPLRGKDRKLLSMYHALISIITVFPSPCGEKIENYLNGLIQWVMLACIIAMFPSPCGEKIENYWETGW
jgi:hypothetical protein